MKKEPVGGPKKDQRSISKAEAKNTAKKALGSYSAPLIWR